jgi:heptosyltransferase-3
MTPTLLPADLLHKQNKILFIAHLALGDFTYLQNCFAAFARAFPNLEVHLWVDEVRRTSDAAQWPQLQKYSLYDWLAACPFFTKVYSRTYSPALYQASIREAQQEQYAMVVSLATLRPHLYADLAHSISPDGFVVGIRERFRLHELHRQLAYRKLDASLPRDPLPAGSGYHISDAYAEWFRQLCGLDLPTPQRLPFVHIPPERIDEAQQRLASWQFASRKLVFINSFAKTKKRCWPLENVAELLKAMQQRAPWRDACFIVNAMPHEVEGVRQVIAAYGLEHVELFSAGDNFFQLPAMLAQCDLIISVETAVMHLANAVHVPVIALMRQKNPEWVPVDRVHSTVITAPGRHDWVKAISVKEVMAALP